MFNSKGSIKMAGAEPRQGGFLPNSYSNTVTMANPLISSCWCPAPAAVVSELLEVNLFLWTYGAAPVWTVLERVGKGLCNRSRGNLSTALALGSFLEFVANVLQNRLGFILFLWGFFFLIKTKHKRKTAKQMRKKDSGLPPSVVTVCASAPRTPWSIFLPLDLTSVLL